MRQWKFRLEHKSKIDQQILLYILISVLFVHRTVPPVLECSTYLSSSFAIEALTEFKELDQDCLEDNLDFLPDTGTETERSSSGEFRMLNVVTPITFCARISHFLVKIPGIMVISRLNPPYQGGKNGIQHAISGEI